jgi:ATP-binding cassette, subfamily B, multidrug efflux pump
MFRWFEKALQPTVLPDNPEPPPTLLAFYWHFASQAKGLFVALFVTGFIVALLDVTIPVFIGRVVTLVTASDPAALFAQSWHLLLGMAVVLVVLRPLALTAQNMVANQAIAANVTNLIRWQSHWHVVRQSWAFFQNDFAGRIANKVMQTGPAIRQSLVSMITAVWYILVYGTSAMLLLASADPWLALPILVWFAGYAILLRIFVPRMRDTSVEVSEARSILTGRIVDTYTNILTLKLFARAREEDAYVRNSIETHTGYFHASLRLNTLFTLTLSTLNAAMVVSVAGLSIYLWTQGKVQVGTVAMALPLAWQIVNMAGWVAYQITDIFENIGVVQEGMRAIARPLGLTDRPDAKELKVTRGEIEFQDIRFGYGSEKGLIEKSLAVRETRREDRPRRPFRRRKVHAGQSAAALLRAGKRPHPHRRAGHRADDAGIIAHPDFGGDAGHLAAAPLDPRQYPLWPPLGDRR